MKKDYRCLWHETLLIGSHLLHLLVMLKVFVGLNKG